jgi:hypothetical protein
MVERVRGLPVLMLLVVVAIAICVGGCGSAKPKSSSAWLTPHGLIVLESTFPPTLQTAIGVAAPIAISDADCSRTSTQSVYLCTVDTTSSQPIAYFVKVKDGAWTGRLDKSKTDQASIYPTTVRSSSKT